MQDMTSEACSQAPLNTQKTLTDIRDGNTYTVARIQNKTNINSLCWMTQNLDLDLTNITLTSADSDVANNWTPNLASAVWSSNNATDLKYFDPGMYVYSTPTEANNCGSSGVTSLSQCTEKGWVDVTGWTASADPSYSVIADTINQTYNAHFLAGNYYSWATVTANTSNSITSGDTTSSICPKGWRLPTGVHAGEFYNLLSGFTKGDELTIAPYYFIYGGNIDNKTLKSAGNTGYYWSSSAAGNSTGAYDLTFYNSMVQLFNTGNRYWGMSVRCVAK